MAGLNDIFYKIQKTQAGEVFSKEKKIFSKGDKRYRLIHKNPIGHSLLNFAITKAPQGEKSSRYVAIKLKLGATEELTQVWVNMNSLAKRLHLNKKEILEHRHDPDFEGYIYEKIKLREAEIEKEFEAKQKEPNAAQPKVSLKGLSIKAKAVLSDIVFGISLGLVNHSHLRSISTLSSESLDNLSKARAVREYHKAADKVPAYKDFLKKSDHSKPKKFEEVPITDKETYIKPNTLESTLIGGKLPKGGQVDTSTGTTGKPTVWVRSAKERALNRKLLDRVRQELVGEAFFINAYALGGLSTGLTAHTALVDKNLLISTGPDCEKVLDMVKQFGSKGEKIVISGYPSFMSTLIDVAEKRGMNLNDYNLVSIVGGEAISERLRDRLTGGGFQKVISGYGASDLDINIGFETDFCVSLRKECLKNPSLAKEFFGEKTGSPMIFQYNPLLYYVETDDKSNLIYTSIGGEKISPRIRYNSHDIGITLTGKEMKAKLKKYHIDFELPKTNLPFVFVWGREGTAVSYYAAKVIPEELERAIQNIPEIKDKVENYALHSYEDEKGELKLDFWIELKEKAGIDTSKETTDAINAKILEQIRKHSMDFTRMDDIAVNNKTERPELKLFAFGTGPMANQPSHKKKQFIYRSSMNLSH